MVAKNPLLLAPPYPIEKALKQVGENLRLARMRRRLTIAEAGQKIGAGPRAVASAENGKPSTSIGVYAALLWSYDLLGPFAELADPSTDEQGLALSSLRKGTRVRKSKGLSGDF